MNSKTLLVTGLATAALLAGAVYLADKGASPHAAETTATGPLFADLKTRVNDVTEVTIAGGGASCTLRKEGASWGAADKGGFPVDFGKVKALVLGIAEMERVEAMTSNAALHAKLGVEDPTAEGATSKRVTIKGAGGAVLADVIVGRAKASQGMSSRSTLYVRAQGDAQAWEATGSLTVDTSSTGWFDRNISKVEEKRVRRATITHPSGETLAAARADQSQTNLAVENLPAGKELQWDGVANGIASALQYMSLDDVQSAGSVEMTDPVVTEYSCFDGLVVTARSIDKDGKTWITLAARLDESLRAATAGPEAPPAEGESAPVKLDLKALDLVQKEVDELNARWSPWVFQVPGYNGANLRKKLADLLKQDAPEESALEDAALDIPHVLPTEPATEPAEDHTGHDHEASQPSGGGE